MAICPIWLRMWILPAMSLYLFTWNGTTSGVRVPNGDWMPRLAADRAGLTIFAMPHCRPPLPCPCLGTDDMRDVTTYSWQKVCRHCAPV